jgi:hypothetical protein
MLCAALDIHKHVFQAVVVEPWGGVEIEDRIAAAVEGMHPVSGGSTLGQPVTAVADSADGASG